MIVFGVTATRNQLCPSRSIREAPSSRFSAHDIASELVRGLTHPQLDLLGRLGARPERRHSSTTRGGRPERSMDEGAGGGDTAGMLPMLGFETRHRTASGGAERSHLPPARPCRRDKILPWSGPLSRIAVFGRPSRHQNRTKSMTWIFHTRPTPMQTDIVLDEHGTGRRIVIDTRFTSILKAGWYRDETLSSAYLYQIYAYLRSQVGRGDRSADHAEGLLLHPAVGESVDEFAIIQEHRIRFGTVDLAAFHIGDPRAVAPIRHAVTTSVCGGDRNPNSPCKSDGRPGCKSLQDLHIRNGPGIWLVKVVGYIPPQKSHSWIELGSLPPNNQIAELLPVKRAVSLRTES